jgi:signal recognition particle receptor subunit beta
MPKVNARIVLWGIEGAGKSTSLRTIHAKLRPDLRGDLKSEPTRLDPTVHFESLTIQLGETAGVAMQIEIVAVPGAPDQTMTRKQLLDEVDGIVIVLDASPERIEENYASIDELRSSLAAYGQRLDAFPVVLQYNKRDVADPFAIEELHRRIGLDQAAVFETIATSGHGILSTLTTISKHVVRARRAEGTQGESQSAVSSPTPQPIEVEPEIEQTGMATHEILEAAIIAESENENSGTFEELVELDPETGTQPNWDVATERVSKPENILGADLRIVSVGQAAIDTDGGVRLPMVLGDESGQTRTVVLSLRLDSLDSPNTTEVGGND